MTIARILAEKGNRVISIDMAMPLTEVTKQLTDNRIGAVLVLDEQQAITGIVSERDIVRWLGDEGEKALRRPASDVMTSPVVTCNPQDTEHMVMEIMTLRRIRHVPVVEDGELIGLVSIGDLVKRRIENAERQVEDIRAYINAG